MSDRAAKLLALRKKAGKATDQQSPAREEQPNVNVKAVVFRNYAPKDEGLLVDENGGGGGDEEEEVTDNKRVKISDGNNKEEEEDVEDEPVIVKTSLQLELEETRIQSQKISNSKSKALPKKINYDLKRDCEKRLSKLEKRTSKIVGVLLRERLLKEADEGGSGGSDEEGGETGDID